MASIPYTLVRHTGYSVGKNPQFQRAVEERSITPSQVAKVLKSGGRVFDNYADAHDRAEAYNYPPSHVGGLIPNADGTFVNAGIGEEVFIPKTYNPR